MRVVHVRAGIDRIRCLARVGTAAGGIVPPVTEFAVGAAATVESALDATGLQAATAADAIVASVPFRVR
jgi:hypothetical protein